MKCKNCKYYQLMSSGAARCTKPINELNEITCVMKLNLVATTKLLQLLEKEAGYYDEEDTLL